MEDDWDLQAVVRGCTASAASSAAAATTSFAVDLKPRSFCFPSCGIKQDVEDEKFVCFPDPFERRNAIEELHELYKPFFPKSQQPLSPPINIPSPNFSALGGFKNQSQQQQQQPQQQQQQPQQQSKQFLAGSVTATNTTTTTAITSTHSQTTRSKRRKNQLKKVCQVPAEGLSSDIWSWRKYGQKPIKGSPYPRGYYRCSSSKGCLARKQVERNRSDPTMFIVTYTAEHNHPVPTHRNSLAGTTRHHHKPPSSSSPMANESNNNPITKPSSCSNSTATISTNSIEDEVEQRAKLENRVDIEQEEEEEEEEIMVEDGDEDEMGFSDTAVTDDFFEGLDEIKGAVTGDCFSDPFPASFSLSWMSKNPAATTAGGS